MRPGVLAHIGIAVEAAEADQGFALEGADQPFAGAIEAVVARLPVVPHALDKGVAIGPGLIGQGLHIDVVKGNGTVSGQAYHIGWMASANQTAASSDHPQGHPARAGVARFGLADGLGCGGIKTQAVFGHVADFIGETLGAGGQIGQLLGELEVPRLRQP
jgi:hypothetical protein